MMSFLYATLVTISDSAIELKFSSMRGDFFTYWVLLVRNFDLSIAGRCFSDSE